MVEFENKSPFKKSFEINERFADTKLSQIKGKLKDIYHEIKVSSSKLDVKDKKYPKKKFVD